MGRFQKRSHFLWGLTRIELLMGGLYLLSGEGLSDMAGVTPSGIIMPIAIVDTLSPLPL